MNRPGVSYRALKYGKCAKAKSLLVLILSFGVIVQPLTSDFRSTHSNICHIADFIILKYVISDKNRTNESYLDIFSVRGQQSVTLDECYCKCLF